MTRRRASFLFLLLLFSLFFSVIPASAQETEYKTIYMIDVRMDGSATWMMKNRIALATRGDEDAFRKYMEEFEAKKGDHIGNFSNRMNRIISDAEAATGRGMASKNFDISLDIIDTVIGKYGVIEYQFDWIGFAEVKDRDIIIGDVFVGGFYLSMDDALIIRCPARYRAETTIPEPDATRANELVWYGLRDFGSGEPRVVLKPKLIVFSPIWVGIIVLIVMGAFILRKKLAREVMKTDEDRIIELLREARGAMYQSDIVERTGFSKSKTSALLNAMKQNGIIQKVKKGRENLIRLS